MAASYTPTKMTEPSSKTAVRLKRIASLVLLLTTVLCLALLAISTYPGVLQDIYFYGLVSSVIWVPIGAMIGVWYLVTLIRSGLTFTRWPLFRLGLAVVILVCTYGMLRKYVPRRLAFIASRTAFTAALSNTPHEADQIDPVNS